MTVDIDKLEAAANVAASAGNCPISSGTTLDNWSEKWRAYDYHVSRPGFILALIAELRDLRAQAEAVIAATGLTEDERVNGDPVKAAQLLSHAFDVFTNEDAARREEFNRNKAIVDAAKTWALTWFDRHPHDPPKSEASRALYEAVLGKAVP